MLRNYFLVTVLFAAFLSANTEVVKVEAEGFGASTQQAIDRALTEAMGRVNGKSIDSEVLISSSEKTVTENDSTEYLASQEYKDKINSKTKGVVQSYDILESGNDSGTYSVKLSVSVVKFKASASANRKRMAVLPLTARNSCCRVEQTRINEQPMSEELSAAISAYLVQTRKFTVLDRA